MEKRLDKIMEIAEELSNIRSSIESKMLKLKQQLSVLRDDIDFSIHEFELHGLDANLKKINSLDERALSVTRKVKEIKQQSASLDQALSYIRSAKKISDS